MRKLKRSVLIKWIKSMRPIQLLIVIGMLSALLSFSMDSYPRHYPENWFNNTQFGDTEAYFVKAKATRTYTSYIFDISTGISSMLFSFACLIYLRGVNNWRYIHQFKTPPNKIIFVIAANLIWLSFMCLEWLFLCIEALRNQFPPWADSLAIPASSFISVTYIGFVFVNIGVGICLIGAKLPVLILVKASSLWRRIIGIFLVLLAFFWIILTFESLYYGGYLSIPAQIAIVYLLLCGRAAVISSEKCE